MSAKSPEMPSLLVLDTNVVLDWLVFRDASAALIGAAIADGTWHWMATAAMRSELEHVLTLERVSTWNPDRASVLAAWQTHARLLEPAVAPLWPPLRCTDPDDQMFIDFARQIGPCTLLSRDRAVLKLARRARVLGLRFCTPEAWSAAEGVQQVPGA